MALRNSVLPLGPPRLWGPGLAAQQAVHSLFSALFGYFNTALKHGKPLPIMKCLF